MPLVQHLLHKLKSPVALTILLVGIVLLFSDYQFRWKNQQWQSAVHTDAADYYRYLPMVFVNHQMDGQVENPQVVKYFVGTAICYLPFFTLAYGCSVIAGLPPDGYSMLFPVFISIGTLFYLLFGLHYLSKFLRYYALSDSVICLLLVALSFGTMAFQYTVMAPGWCHIVALALVCYLLYHFKKLLTTFQPGSIIALIAAGSLLFFVRPTDLIVVVIAPFLANDFRHFFTTFKRVFSQPRAIFIGALLAAIPLVCQLLIYRWGTGEFFVWSYTKEGFDFSRPEIANVLFSYAKGLFIYTPLCFLALFGLFVLYRRSRYQFVGAVLYLSLNIYIIASWWCWNYGYSYGTRAFIEHYPVFILLLGLLLTVRNRWVRSSTVVLLVAFTGLNLFQTYQANTGILDHDYKTTARGYWDVFLRTDKGYSGKFYRYEVNERPENVVQRVRFQTDMERADTTWINVANRSEERAHSGKFSSKVSKKAPFSTGKYVDWNAIPYKRNVLIRASGWFYIPQRGSNSFFAISFVADNKSTSFNTFAMDGYTRHFGRWEYHVFEMHMPKFSETIEQAPGKRIEFYLYNDAETPCYVDDLNIEFIEFRQMERILDLSWE